jgi:chemotaxis protein CheX
MKKESIQIILENSVKFILDETGFTAVSVAPSPEATEPAEIVVTIGITGGIKGILMLRFGLPDAIRVADLLLANTGQVPEGQGLDENRKASLSEVANLFTGRFINLLSEEGVDCNLTPPSIISGHEIGVSIRDTECSVQLSITNASWRFVLSLFIIKS